MGFGVGDSEPLLESGFHDIHLVSREAKAWSGVGYVEQHPRMDGTHPGGTGSWRGASHPLLMVFPTRTVYSEAFLPWDPHLLLLTHLKRQ